MNWLYALLFFLFLFIAKQRSSIWGDRIIRIIFFPTPILSQLKNPLFYFCENFVNNMRRTISFQLFCPFIDVEGFFSLQISYSSTSGAHSFLIFSCSHFPFFSSRAPSFFHCPLVVSAFAPDRVKEHHLQGDAICNLTWHPKKSIFLFSSKIIYEGFQKNRKELREGGGRWWSDA